MRLTPERRWLDLANDQFDALYAALLAQMDPRAVFDALGDRAVMLCWERPGGLCHRRYVAEWFEFHLAVVVPEWGIDRATTGFQSPAVYPFHRTLEERRAWLAGLAPDQGPDDLGKPIQLELFPELPPPKRRRR
jgi:hypothetical protein